MGSGPSRPNQDRKYREPRQRASSPDDTEYEKIYLQKQQKLAKIDKTQRGRSSTTFEQSNINLAKISSTNSWLTCFFTETRSIKKSDLQPIPPNVSPWPQEAQSINEVMVGRHCSDTPLTSTPRRSEVVRKKRKRKAKVSCYLPSENEGLPEPRQRNVILDPLKKESSTKALRTPVPQFFNRLRTIPKISRSPKVKHEPKAIRRARVRTIASVPYEIVNASACVPRVRAKFTRFYGGKLTSAKNIPKKESHIGAITHTPVCPVEYTSDPHLSSVHTRRPYVRVTFETALAVDDPKPLCYMKPVGVTSAVKSSYIEPVSIGAISCISVSPVECTSDPHLSCVHTLRRSGKVAFETAQIVDVKENSRPLCYVKPVGVTSAVKSSYIESASALRKRQLHGINIKEAPGYFYYSARVIQYPNPWSALRVLPPPNEVMGVSTFVQTNDFLQRAVLNQPRTYFVLPTQRCHSACLEAVQKVDYDQVYRLVGDEKVQKEKSSPKLHIPQDGRFRLPPIRLTKPGPKILPKNSRVDSQSQALIQHRIGFFPPLFEEQPVIDTNRIDINHAKDLVPRDGRLRLPPIRGSKKVLRR